MFKNKEKKPKFRLNQRVKPAEKDPGVFGVVTKIIVDEPRPSYEVRWSNHSYSTPEEEKDLRKA